MSTKFKKQDRVALKSDIRHRGYIYNVYAKYNADDEESYTVQWDKDGQFLYIVSALISETEANKIQAQIDAKKVVVDDKFKSMEKKDEK